MSSTSACPDPNPTRAQLRLVVVGQWVRAGLALARGAANGRGLVGGAVALWQVFQAIRLAIELARRLSELQGVLSAARVTQPGGAGVQGPWSDLGSDIPSDDPAGVAAWLSQAQAELTATMRDALGFAADRHDRPDGVGVTRAVAEPEVPCAYGRPSPPRGLRPVRPPGSWRWRARRRRLPRGLWLETTLNPIAAPATGRCRLAAG